MSTPEEWYRNLPYVTRLYLTTAFATTLLTTFNVISPMMLYLDFHNIINRFHFWRLLSCFVFFGKFSLPFIMQMVILVQFFGSCERTYFTGLRGRAEFIFFMLCTIACVYLVHCTLVPIYFGGEVLIFAAMHYWCRREPTRLVNLYGFQIKAWYFPFVLLVLNMLLGANIVFGALGVLIGHLFWFLTEFVPIRYQRKVLKCPDALYSLIQNHTDVGAPPPPRFRQGQGYRLDAD